MARQFLIDIDLKQNELRNAVIHNLGTAPLSGKAGQVYYNTGSNQLFFHNGTSWQSAGQISITLGGDLSGTASTNASGQITLNATIEPNSVALGTDTSGNYVATLSSTDTHLTIANSGTETAAVTIVTDATALNTASAIVSRDSNGNFAAGTITANLTGDVTGNLTGDIKNTDGTVILDSGNSNAVATFTGDVVGNAATAGKLLTAKKIELTGDIVGEVQFDGSQNVQISTAIQPNSVALGTDTTGNYVAGISGTTNQITVTGSGSESAAVTIGLPDNVEVVGNLQVGGNLNVVGTVNSVNTTQVNIVDNKINLNTAFTGVPTTDAGIRVERGDAADVEILWNETDDKWTLTNDGSAYHHIVRKYAETLSTSLATYTISHMLGSEDVVVQVFETGGSKEQVEVGVEHFSPTQVKLQFATAPTAGAYRVVITG
jgi:hypothetical protein